MELKPYAEATSFSFGNLTVRDMTPETFTRLSMAEAEVPIGADNPPFAENRKEKIYVCLRGEVEFTCDGEKARLRPGDVLVLQGGEQYSYHNGGYEPAHLLVMQRPGRPDS